MYLAGMFRIDLIMISITDFIILVRSGGLVLIVRRLIFTKDVRWSTYMDYEVANSTPQLKEDYKYMRYACMNRNRDNNGDGKIDRNEVRWYLAAL